MGIHSPILARPAVAGSQHAPSASHSATYLWPLYSTLNGRTREGFSNDCKSLFSLQYNACKGGYFPQCSARKKRTISTVYYIYT